MPASIAGIGSMADWFGQAFGSAVEDIRNKLIEEGWFGRKTVEPGQHDGLGWECGDRVLYEKLYPDKGREAAFLDWVNATYGPEPEQGDARDPSPGHDLER